MALVSMFARIVSFLTSSQSILPAFSLTKIGLEIVQSLVEPSLCDIYIVIQYLCCAVIDLIIKRDLIVRECADWVIDPIIHA